MKRIYMLLSLIGGFAVGANAQGVDLMTISVIDTNYNMPPTGKPFTLTGIFDTEVPGGDSLTAGVLMALRQGSSLLSGDQVFYIGPSATVSSEGVSGWLYTAQEDLEATTNNLAFTVDQTSFRVSDSIHTLLNIPNFLADSNFFVDLLVARENLVIGQTYGWYGMCRPYPEGAYSDPDPTNNWSYTPIIWGGETSIKDAFKSTKLTPLVIWPNPTVDQVSFELHFVKVNKSTVARVLDVTGRVVSTTNFGSNSIGKQNFSVNVSKLVAGTYSLQVITDNVISVEKFIKK